MDKLKPIIENRFWILAGLLLPIAMFGFFSANAKLSEATQAREEALKSTLSSIPRGTGDPNDKYSEGLSKINGTYSESVDRSILQIWQKQQERMDWPPVVSNYVPKKFMDEFDYRGVVAYQEAYEKVMRDLQARVEPVMPLNNANRGGAGPMAGISRNDQITETPWKQKVILAASIPQARFGRMRPTSDQIWNAQIDVWLLRLLFDAVSRLNEDKDSATEAILRRIDVLELFGGDGEPVLTGGGSSGGGGYGGDDDEMGGLGMAFDSGGGSGGGGDRGRDKKSVSIAFNPAQEFGSDADSEGGGGDSDDADANMGAAGYGGGGRRSTSKLRYIADTEEKPFLERGFYLSVIVMQDKIPDFLVELANSEWPIRVTRFHVGKNPYYKESRGANFGSGFPGGGFGGEMSFDDDAEMQLFSGGAGGLGSESAFGGVGGNEGPSIPGVGGLGTNLPAFAEAAMQHSNLVQVDLCGVITIYKQPPSVIEAIENGSSTAPGSEASPADGNQTDEAGAPEALPAEETPATEAGEATAAPADTDTTESTATENTENPDPSEL